MKNSNCPSSRLFFLLLVAALLASGKAGAATNMMPVAVTGFNRDVVIEATASGPPFTSAATPVNAGENFAYYQTGLPTYAWGMPPSGAFVSLLGDNTIFQMQSYTSSNALVLSPSTGLTSGTLTLVTPAVYASIAVVANSGNGSNLTGPLTFHFNDGSTVATTYFAPDWFNGSNYIAWFGPGRVDVGSGDDSGGPEQPCFYQTTINLAGMLGASNKPLTAITFGKALANSTAIFAVSGLLAADAPAPSLPVAANGWNRDLFVENTASATPYTALAAELNPGEGKAFYQAGLRGTSYGFPTNGVIYSAVDGAVFQLRPYTASNALVLSSDTKISVGTLTLATPAVLSRLSLLANSAGGGGTATVTFNFTDGTTLSTNYNAPDWFQSSANVALAGFDRISLSSGATEGGPANPRLYETTFDLTALFGAAGKTLNSLTFSQAAGAGATAIYALSGVTVSPANGLYALAAVTNAPASNVQARTAAIGGGVGDTGGAAPAALIYYGTSDAGTNAKNWGNHVYFGSQNSAFTTALSGLSVSTTYYFRAAAVNPAGVAWAPASQAFTTSNAFPAALVNLPATNVGPNAAILSGNVTNPSGDAPVVTLYYGTSDGGNAAASWANRVTFSGTQSGWFGRAVTGLMSNTAYYFTVSASNAGGVSWASPSLAFTTPPGAPTPLQLVSILTGRNDNTRSGLNTNESVLTLANVNTNTFGRLFSYALDGYMVTQPLVMANVLITNGAVRNLVFASTQHNSVYAFDADTFGPAYWHTTFLDQAAGVSAIQSTVDLQASTSPSYFGPELGISGTPVIDPATGTLYVEANTKQIIAGVTNYIHQLHALDVRTGAEKFGGPVLITGATPGVGDGFAQGSVPFLPGKHMNRSALLLAGGNVVVTFTSHQDFPPYHGWIFTYNAYTLQLKGVVNTTPNGSDGGIWQATGGPAADAQGNIYMETGNGTFDAANQNYGDAVIKLSQTNGLAVADYFAPYNQLSLNLNDYDVGSAGLALLPDEAGSAAHPHLLVAGSKPGVFWVLDRDNLGQFNPMNDSQVVQEVSGSTGWMWVTPAYFNHAIYYCANGDHVKAFAISNAVLNPTPFTQSASTASYPGSSLMISANGASNAIVWGLDSSGNQANPAVLHAYNATNLTQELYNSSIVLSRDNPGNTVKYTMPTIANGKAYVGTVNQLAVYGNVLYSGQPVISPNGGIFTNAVTVSLTTSVAGAKIYYTLDGTTPTANSLLYMQPFDLTNSAGLQAIAIAPGQGVSSVAQATFYSSSSIGTGTGLLGQYYANTTYGAPFTGTALNRVDPVIDFNWNTASPDPSIPLTDYTVRWLGFVQPQFNETYTFSTTTDDGVRLWVNGQELVNNWIPQSPTTWSGSIALRAGQIYSLEMDYFQSAGGAVAELDWSSPSVAPAVVPESQLYPLTAPQFTAASSGLTNGVFSVQMTVIPGSTYVLQGSIDLAHWAALETNTAASPNVTFSDTNAAHLPWRFYRAVQTQ